jgi:hypothetical protein
MIAKYTSKKALEEAKCPDEEFYNFLDYPIRPGCGGVIFRTANPYCDPSF